MGLFDKIKGILFDEEEIEVPVSQSEPVETHVPKKTREQKGFIDHSGEEDTIKEIIVPKDNYEEPKQPEKKGFTFPIDIDDEEPEDVQPIRRTRATYTDDETKEIPRVAPTRTIDLYETSKQEEVKPRKNYKLDEQPKKVHEEIDYHKLLEKKSESDKKQFSVTPVISPVYGILDKNYKPEEITEKSKEITTLNTSGVAERTFGPVSYNDQPRPERSLIGNEESEEDEFPRITKTKTRSKKSDLVELNKTITEMAEEEMPEIENDEEIITSGIENEYIDHNNIEDAFESTSEFDSITESDSEIESAYIDDEEETTEEIRIHKIIEEPEEDIIENDDEEEPVLEHRQKVIRLSDDEEEQKPQIDEDDEDSISVENFINSRDEESNDEEDDTMETDLFNLIDSMYRSDDEEDSEEE